MAEFWNRFG